MTVQLWRVDTPCQSLVVKSQDKRLAEIAYWGGRLSDTVDLDELVTLGQQDVTGGMLDENPPLSVCPESSRTFPGQSGLVVRNSEGHSIYPSFRFDRAEQTPDELNLYFSDQSLELEYMCHFRALDSGLVLARSELISHRSVTVDWFAAPVLPCSQQSDHMIDFAGRWCGEFSECKTQWEFGSRARHNPTGRTGHEHFPGLILPDFAASNTSGVARAVHYGWSGGHDMYAEQLPDGRRLVQFGHARGSYNIPLTHVKSAPLYIAYSNQGINGCSVQFQREVRENLIADTLMGSPRPVHYNCWEAVYFDHSVPELCDIASNAADLGAERFVLDDGWFGCRDDDTTSLGDWWVDHRKYPDGLGPLIKYVNDLGMEFGLWFEPEMINENSETFIKHPQWVLGPVDQIRGRQQLVLNLDLEDVQNYLFDSISSLLSNNNISYMKWDHNRVLPISDERQTLGAYKLIDRLRTAYPQVEIESCSSGGGRIDFGILARTQRVWLSDSNDAIERVRIQAGASRFLPASVTGSHVGPRHCHTSGRSLPIEYRSWVAAQRHLGFEMNPLELDDHERSVVKKVCSWWKDHRDFLMHADIHRLDTIDPAVMAEQHILKEVDRFILFVNKMDTSSQISPLPIQLVQLMPDKKYKLTLVNKNEVHHLSRGMLDIKNGPVELSGSLLMDVGINLPWSFPAQTWVIIGEVI